MERMPSWEERVPHEESQPPGEKAWALPQQEKSARTNRETWLRAPGPGENEREVLESLGETKHPPQPGEIALGGSERGASEEERNDRRREAVTTGGTAGFRSLSREEGLLQKLLTPEKVPEVRRSQPTEWQPLGWITQDQRYVVRSTGQRPHEVLGRGTEDHATALWTSRGLRQVS